MGAATVVVVISVVMAWLGAIVIWRGWAGRFEGEKPFCRRCGFELSGRELSGKCPECGCDLDARENVVHGVRRTRWARIVAGVILLGLSLVPAYLVTSGEFQRFNWESHKPIFWLVHEAKVSDPLGQDAALCELIWRLYAKEISKEKIGAIVDLGLAIQRDPRREWCAAWGDFIETARDTGNVSDAKWKIYADQAVSTQWLSFTTRQRLHMGDEVTTSRVNGGAARVGSTLRFTCELRELGVVVDQKEYTLPPQRLGTGKGFQIMLVDSTPHGMSVQVGNRAMSDAVTTLPTGPHIGYLRLQATVYENDNAKSALAPTSGFAINPNSALLSPPTIGGRVPPAVNLANPFGGESATAIDAGIVQGKSNAQIQHAILAARAAQLRAEQVQLAAQGDVDADAASRMHSAGTITGADVELHLPMKFEVVERDAPVAVAVNDESLRVGVQRALGVYMVNVRSSQVQMNVQCDDPPIDLSYKVLLKFGGDQPELEVGSLAMHAHQTNSPPMLAGVLPPTDVPETQTVDVIFRPDGGVAAGLEGIERYWNGTVVVKDVPVHDPNGTSRRQQRDVSLAAAMERYARRLDRAAGATPQAGGPAIPPTPAPDVAQSITQLKMMQQEMQAKLLAVPREDGEQYREFLKQPDASLVKLLPLGKYDDGVLGIHRGGACYSFVRKTHEPGNGDGEILLGPSGRFTCALGGTSYGYFLPLGDVRIEDAASTQTNAEAAPKWASSEVAAQWTAMWRTNPLSSEAVRIVEMSTYQPIPATPGTPGPSVSAEPGRTYLLRSLSADADALIAFRTIRKFDDGSVVIAYRVLKKFETRPAAQILPSGLVR